MAKTFNIYEHPSIPGQWYCEIDTEPSSLFSSALSLKTHATIRGFIFSGLLTGSVRKRTHIGVEGSPDPYGSIGTTFIPGVTITPKSVGGSLASLNGTLTKYLPKLGLSGIISGGTNTLHYVADIGLVGEPTLIGEVSGFLTNDVPFDGDLAPVGEITKLVDFNLAGATGTLSAPEPTPNGNLAGLLEDLAANLEFEIQKTLTGTHSLSGTLQALDRPQGTISPTGTLSRQKLKAVQALSGQIRSYNRSLTINAIQDTSWHPPLDGQANVLDLVIEQGALFRRTFKWLDADGNPYDIDRFRFFMIISTVRAAEGTIASTDTTIDIAATAVDGEFTVTIDEDATYRMDFTRAVYILEASFADNTIRLLEGDVRLSRDATIEYETYEKALVGRLDPNGILSPARRYGLTGSLNALSGILSAPQPVKKYGVLYPVGTIERSLNVGVDGALAPVGDVTWMNAMETEGSPDSLTGVLTTATPTQPVGSLNNLSGSVVIEAMKVLAGELEMVEGGI